ncbi:MAG: DNA polymerase III subunit gamma/tau, partial [Rhodospirillales bacterium]|nr:DNA polymerase III subunit gamma/tau [Rhodospirillales bacterium]
IAELAQHFARIADQERVAIEPAALDLIARAADGSVRDGLSLLDQAIAQAEGAVTGAQVADMLGLADRDAVFDLLDAVMAGKPAAALAVTDRAYERGADLGTLLQDLLELLHTITRLKSVPDLRTGSELPEAERTRGADLADRLSIPVLGRAWQMLLKGVAEVESAPDRRAAAEMVLIRLCHVADLPTPGDLVKRLTSGGGPGGGVPTGGAGMSGAAGGNGGGNSSLSASAPLGSGMGGGPMGGSGGAVTAMAGSAALALPAAEMAPAAPRLATFRDVAMLVKERREAMLHAHLVHSVHVVRFAPPVIELRPEADAPRDLAPKLGALLTEATGQRWTIALSTAAGEPTLAAQGSAADAQRRQDAADHPLVRAILDTFPGARIETVHDARVDDYGLPAHIGSDMPLIETPLGEPDMPDFAPPDAEFADEMEPDA